MKNLILIHLLLVAVIYGCREYKDSVRDFIPGTYIRFSQHEYGNEYDTLIISIQNKSANEYKILRKWKYERILDNQHIEPEYKRTNTTGYYDSGHKLLQEQETGDIYSFDVQNNLLFNGPVKYQKL